jgi:hypothetical protein
VNTTKDVCARLQARNKWSEIQCSFCVNNSDNCGQYPEDTKRSEKDQHPEQEGHKP